LNLFETSFYFFLILIFVFSENYLEEDLIIGLFSLIILFFLYFIFQILKTEDIREFRLNIKKVYRIQKKLLRFYYFLGVILEEKFFFYTEKIFFFYFLIKLKKHFFSLKLRLQNLTYKQIYLKTFFINEVKGKIWNSVLTNSIIQKISNEN
jgi:hypothetical protein